MNLKILLVKTTGGKKTPTKPDSFFSRFFKPICRVENFINSQLYSFSHSQNEFYSAIKIKNNYL